MIKQFLILILGVIALAGCNSNPSANMAVTSADTLKENLLEPNSIAKIIAARHAQLVGVKGDLASFKKYIADLYKEKLPALNGFTNVSIVPLAFDYINTCIPATENGDSVFYYFNKLFYAAADRLSDSLFVPAHDSLIARLDANRKTADVVAFTQNLASCGMILLSEEGEYYVSVDPDYFYNNFKYRVSKGLNTYLELNVKEMKEGFSEDAGLLISFEEVYNRAKNWENFLAAYPHSFVEREATYSYAIYMETLLNGMDNSPVFENDSLLPEVKKLYEKIAREEPESKTSKLVTAYYEFLARDNFQRTENTGEFLVQSNIAGMLAVKPHLR